MQPSPLLTWLKSRPWHADKTPEEQERLFLEEIEGVRRYQTAHYQAVINQIKN